MKKVLKYIIFDYGEDSVNYIDSLTNNFDDLCDEIVKFFALENYGEKTTVILWDDLEKFRNFYNENFKRKCPETTVGFQIVNNINSLSFNQYIKTKGNENNSMDDFKRLILHEFVHAVHRKVSDIYQLMWLVEGLSTSLSKQYAYKTDLVFDASLDECIKGGTNYSNYYLMFNYVLNNYGKDYILKIIKDKNFGYLETPRLYSEVNSYYNNFNNSIKI